MTLRRRAFYIIYQGEKKNKWLNDDFLLLFLLMGGRMSKVVNFSTFCERCGCLTAVVSRCDGACDAG
jgi:hypothetical protein